MSSNQMIVEGYAAVKIKLQEVSRRVDHFSPELNTARQLVEKILNDVRNQGAAAVRHYGELYDRASSSLELRANTSGRLRDLSAEQQNALSLASRRIRRYQQHCLPNDTDLSEGGGTVRTQYKPVDSVGLYIPGGKAPLVSSLLMSAIPAQIAGVKRIVMCSPPNIDRVILGAAELLGLTEVYQIGGAQAIGAMAFGLESEGLAPVDMIVGPGNIYVALAKRAVMGVVGIDAFYGPSELVIIADNSASPTQLAYDIMSQLEHGSGLESGILLTTDAQLAASIHEQFVRLVIDQPNRSTIERAWRANSFIGVLDSLAECIEMVNWIAPEHLEIKVRDARKILPEVRHAGAIFVGASVEAIGDYLAGPSHCLPTGRSARFSSGLSVMNFLKRNCIIDMQPNTALVEATAIIARMEGMEAHALSAESSLSKSNQP